MTDTKSSLRARMSIGYNTVYYVLVFAVNLEPPSRRQEISGAWEINPYKFVSPIY